MWAAKGNAVSARNGRLLVAAQKILPLRFSYSPLAARSQQPILPSQEGKEEWAMVCCQRKMGSSQLPFPFFRSKTGCVQYRLEKSTLLSSVSFCDRVLYFTFYFSMLLFPAMAFHLLDFTDFNYFRLLQTPKFNDIIKLNTCRLAYKIIHYEEPPGLCQTIDLKLQNSRRRPHDIVPTQKPNQKLEHHIMFKIANIWNSMPSKVKEPCTPHTFKERAKKALIQKYDDAPNCTVRKCPSCVTGRPFQSLTT